MYRIIGLILLVFLSLFVLNNCRLEIDSQNIQILAVTLVVTSLYIILHHMPNKEDFMIYETDKSLLQLSKSINADSIDAEINDDNDNISSIEQNNDVVKYGDIIYLQSNSVDNRFLTGGRGGNELPKLDMQGLLSSETPQLSQTNIELNYPKVEVIICKKNNKYLSIGEDGTVFSRDYVDINESFQINKNIDKTSTIKSINFNKYLRISPNEGVGTQKFIGNQSKFDVVKQSDVSYLIKLRGSNMNLRILDNGMVTHNTDDITDNDRFIFKIIDFGDIQKHHQVIIRQKNVYLKVSSLFNITAGESYGQEARFKIKSIGDNKFSIISLNSNTYLEINSTGHISLNNSLKDNGHFYIFHQLDKRYTIKSVKYGNYLSISVNRNVTTHDKVHETEKFTIEPHSTIIAKNNSENNVVSKRNNNLSDYEHGGLNQQVFSTNEDGPEIQWIIRSELITGNRKDYDPNRINPIRYGDVVYLQTNYIDNRFLVGGFGGSKLPYSYSNNEGVITLGKDYHKSYGMEWIIRSNPNSGSLQFSEDDNKFVRYHDKIFLQSKFSEDKFLSGSRNGAAIDQPNQKVYSVSLDEGKESLKWIIRKDKGDGKRPMIQNKDWPLWEYQPGKIGITQWKNKFTASSCKGYSPYKDNIKLDAGSYSSNNYFGEPCRSATEDWNFTVSEESEPIGMDAAWKVLKSESGWSAGSDSCYNGTNAEFLVVNLGTERYLGNGRIYPGANNGIITKFSVKLAKKDGLFTDLNDFSTNFMFQWMRNNTEIFIEDYFGGILSLGSTLFQGGEVLTHKHWSYGGYQGLGSSWHRDGHALEQHSHGKWVPMGIITHPDHVASSNSMTDISKLKMVLKQVEKPKNNILPVSRKNERFTIYVFDNQIYIKTSNNMLLSANKDKKTISFVPFPDNGIIPPEWTLEKFKVEYVVGGWTAFRTAHNTYLSMENKIIMQSPEYPGSSLPETSDREKFKIHSTDPGFVNNMFYDFDIKRTAQYVKIIPHKSYGSCSMRLSLYPLNSNVDLVEALKSSSEDKVTASSCFKYNNGDIAISHMGQSCNYGGYATNNIDRFGGGGWMASQKDTEGSSFIIYDNKKEEHLKGGIIYGRDDYEDNSCSSCNNYVEKFTVQVAGNNKQFRDIGRYETNFDDSMGKNTQFKFPIDKKARYVKLILLKCSNKCSMRLDIF